MERSIIILGRQPAIGLAELESLYGAAVSSFGHHAAIVDLPPQDIDFPRLGSAIKLAGIITGLPTGQWSAVEKRLHPIAKQLVKTVPAGKLKLGLSANGLDTSIGKLGAAGLTLKKALRGKSDAEPRSVRVIPNNDGLELSSAQVLHNGLAKANGIELLLISDGRSTLIARTTGVQDIDAYAARDQRRPKRDARVGMLPPKLAQTIVNLATSVRPADTATTVLDPFCGTGVVLQEAALMGFGGMGSDLEPRMVDYTAQNLQWLQDTYGLPKALPGLQAADAITASWQPAPDCVAAETYLGQPFSAVPIPEKLEDVRSNCNLIVKKFLRNIAPQLAPGARLCLAVPAWQTKPGRFVSLPLLTGSLDHLSELGYNRVSFKHVSDQDLIYARADQIVARQLLVLIKN